MNWWARLGQGRLAAEVRFVLGGALAGATAGLAVGFLTVVESDSLFTLVVGTSHGVGLGWWGGLAWSVLFALRARRTSPPAPVAALTRGAWVAAAAVALGALLAHLSSVGIARGVWGGLIAGSLLTHFLLTRATTLAQK